VSERPPTKRRYDNRGRAAAARATHRRIIESAGVCFAAQGYAGTSLREIATTATVSVETVRAVFGTKVALLQAWVDHAIDGDDEPMPVVQRERMRAVREAPDLEDRIRAAAAAARAINARVVHPYTVVRAAAPSDPGVAEIAKTLDARHRRDTVTILGWLERDVPLRPGLTRARAVDLADLAASIELYRILVIERKWSATAFEDQVRRMLLDLFDRSGRS
jgi:AcrR family transcriptional regulator